MNTEQTLGEQKGFSIAVWGLYLSGLLIPVLGPLIGLIMSYVKRGEANSDAERSHYDKAISTFWIALVLLIGGWLLTFAMGLGLVILIPVGIWILVVCVKGIVKAISDKPYA